MSKKIPKTICIFGAQFLLEQVQQLESQIDGVQTGKDIEYVHQMRVASRRLAERSGPFQGMPAGETV